MTNKTAPSRRKFLTTALAGAGAAAAVPLSVKADEYITPSMTTPGKAFTPYGMPSGHEEREAPVAGRREFRRAPAVRCRRSKAWKA